jgi:hypothetical protein
VSSHFVPATTELFGIGASSSLTISRARARAHTNSNGKITEKLNHCAQKQLFIAHLPVVLSSNQHSTRKHAIGIFFEITKLTLQSKSRLGISLSL